MTKPYKIGIVGCGKIVESVHLPVLLNIPEVSVKWIFDTDESRSVLLANMYKIDQLCARDFDNKLEDIDICLIAVPYGVREKYIVKCASLNKAVYVEKPFATSVCEHLKFCNLYSPSDLAIGFQRRYYKWVSDIQYLIANQIFGYVEAIYFNQGYFHLKGGGGYMADAKMAGGGIIIESAIHTLDQILLSTKAINIEILNVESLSKGGIDYDSKFSTIVHSESCKFPVHCHISSIRNLDNGIKIVFNNAIVQFQPTAKTGLFVSGKNDSNFSELAIPEIYNESNCTNINSSFVQFWIDFLNAIRTKKTNMTNAVNSILTTTWIEQIYTKINREN